MHHPAKRTLHFDDATGGDRDKKKERRRQSDRPSSTSLSEEGSFVCCIVSFAAIRSIFLRAVVAKKKRTNGKCTPEPTAHATNGSAKFGPRLPRTCFAFPAWGLSGARLGGRGKQSSRSPHAWRKTDLRISGQGRSCAGALLQVLQRKPAKVRSHRGIFRTDHICGA